MQKKRKKVSDHSKQKLIYAQQRNDFYKRLSVFCKTITGEDVIKLIPVSDWPLLYNVRSNAATVVAEEGCQINSKKLDVVKQFFNIFLKEAVVPIEATNKTVSIYDYYTLGISLLVYLQILKDDQYENAAKVKLLLGYEFGDFSHFIDIIHDKVYEEALPFFSIITNSYCDQFCSFRIDLGQPESNSRIQLKIVTKVYPIEKKEIAINGKNRSIFRIGWTFNTNVFEWLYVTPLQLGIPSISNDFQIPVYIQMHALTRLVERLDCIHLCTIFTSIYYSLRACVVIKEKNNFIIEYNITNVKVGYLIAIMVKGVLVIRTFLFLTCNGTPEGKRLETFIGLKKLDAKYLNMDKLSTFMSHSLGGNDELRSILKKADCLHLVELHDKLDAFSVIHLDNSPLERLSSYLKNDDDKTDCFEFFNSYEAEIINQSNEGEEVANCLEEVIEE